MTAILFSFKFLEVFDIMDKNKQWEIKNREEEYKNRIFSIFRLDTFLPSKKLDSFFYSIHLKNWVNIFAVTENNEIILVKQHRLGKNVVTLEVPAGSIDNGEDPLNAAIRELREETGYTTNNIKLIKQIQVNPAIQDNICYFFIALDCKKTTNTDFDETEEIEVILKTKEEAFSSIALESNLIDNSLALMSVMLGKIYLEN